jgi:[ribosomal protein S5]-alanine N-acetyltransferase
MEKQADAQGRTHSRLPSPPAVIETPRLLLRHMTVRADTAFVLALLNDPLFLEYIGDKGVRTESDAGRYIDEGPRASYDRFGFGLCTVVLKASGEPMGICGLVKREFLDDLDIGYAFLPAFRGRGYAFEASAAVMRYGFDVLGLPRILALTHPDNDRSIRVLEKLGLRCTGRVVIAGERRETLLFGPPAVSCTPHRRPPAT